MKYWAATIMMLTTIIMSITVLLHLYFRSALFTELYSSPALSNLTQSTKVYASVMATNALGLTASATSQPIAMDSTPPVAGTVVELSDRYFIVAGDSNATAEANVYTCDTEEGK